MGTLTVHTHVLLDRDRHKRLRQLARARGCSVSEVIRTGIDQVLDHGLKDSDERLSRKRAAAERLLASPHDKAIEIDEMNRLLEGAYDAPPGLRY